MIINISELLSTPGKSEYNEAPIEMDAFELNGDLYPFSKKEPVKLTITNTGDREISVEGSIEAVLAAPCDRCLKEVLVPFSLKVDKVIDLKKTDEDRINDLDETSYIDHSSLDVDRLVSDELLIHFPMKILCREDCKGICFKCGKDLNLGECGCDRESLDPRMSAIRDIFKNFKEV